VERKGKEAIFFDLDGTLIDSVPDLALAVNEMLQKLQRETFDEETVRNWVGNGSVMLVKRALSGKREIEENSIDEALFQEAHEIFLEAYEKHLCDATRPYPGVLETLRELKSSGYRLSIITNKPHRFVYPILQKLGMDDLFSFFLGGDTLPKKKPDPLPLLQMCEMMDIGKEACVMVGDSGNDMIAAQAAGIHAIGVTYGYHYGEDINKYEPVAVVDDFSELLNIF
jgi:phosphoglycolate phosphatase